MTSFRPTASTLDIFYAMDMLGMYFFFYPVVSRKKSEVCERNSVLWPMEKNACACHALRVESMGKTFRQFCFSTSKQLKIPKYQFTNGLKVQTRSPYREYKESSKTYESTFESLTKET